jgi:hypothetical protein
VWNTIVTTNGVVLVQAVNNRYDPKSESNKATRLRLPYRAATFTFYRNLDSVNKLYSLFYYFTTKSCYVIHCR